MKSLRVLFMGTPEFAVQTLSAIMDSEHKVVGVVTTPDKPAGRGQQVKYSDVKNFALHHKLPIFQPESLKDVSFVDNIRALNADVFVVVAFRMLPKVVYQMPPLGTFNVHASLLPQYRGAAPIQRAIMNGEEITGVTTFLLDEHTDTGQILNQTKVEISSNDDAGTLHDKLMIAGAEIAVLTLNQLAVGAAKPIAQPEVENLKPAPKIFKDDMHINWNDNAHNIYNFVRALSPYPAAFSFLRLRSEEGQESPKTIFLKIFQIEISEKESTSLPGIFRVDKHNNMIVSTKDFDIFIKNLQLEGKKRMQIEDFLVGFRFENYTDILF